MKILEGTIVAAWLILFILLLASNAKSIEGEPNHNFELYDYKIERVIDGDTIVVDAPYLPRELRKDGIRVRIFGVDTPEKGRFAKCLKENVLSMQAKYYVEAEIASGKVVKVWFKDWDKYGGRVLGDILIDGEWLSDKLIRMNFAVPYHGEKKSKDWCK